MDTHIVYITFKKSLRCFASLSTALVFYTVKVIQGTNVQLPCHFPPSSQVTANALWFKETGAGKRTRLDAGDDSTEDNARVELLYPSDHDQTIILRGAVMEDAGTYGCESAEGEKLSTVYIIVEGRFGDLSYTLPCYCRICANL